MIESDINGDAQQMRSMDNLNRHDVSQSARVPCTSASGLARFRQSNSDKIGWPNPSPRVSNVAMSYEDINPLTLPPIQREVTELGNMCIMNRRARSPTPNYTMINKRGKRTPMTPEFNALNSSTKPIPSLFDRPHKEKAFPKKNITLWKNEVSKVVPSRPPIALQSDWKAPPAEWDDRDQYIYGAKPMFYKNTKYVLHRDFVVNPEWLSEFMTVSTYSPAYRTCALRYGWCA